MKKAHKPDHNFFIWAAFRAASTLAWAIFLLVLKIKKLIKPMPPMSASAGSLNIQTGSKNKLVNPWNLLWKHGYIYESDDIHLQGS